MKIGGILYKIKANWLAAFGFTFLALAIIFCLLFLFAGYNQLSRWYVASSPGFYRQDFWAKEFFTQRTKAHGNLFCIGGLLASSTLCFLLARNQHKEKSASGLISGPGSLRVF